MWEKTVERVKKYGTENTAPVDSPEEVTDIRAKVVRLGDVASPLFVRVSRGTPLNHEACGKTPKEHANSSKGRVSGRMEKTLENRTSPRP